jgi:RNA polymerase sigma factor (sigma-70 family)
MASSQMSQVIQHLRRTVLLRAGAGLTDGQLLTDYISRRDEAALAALVCRHGPMVWGVCRRVLGNYHDAEDAFQATFLVLVRKAASIASRELLANWLYGVAHQTALKARATVARRRERQVTEVPEPEVTRQEVWHDLQPLLDEELTRLPDKYRVPIVLCDLEGKTRKEAAQRLGCPEGTVAGRLARARVMLAKRLTQRGVTLSGGALAAILAQNVACASVPASVVSSTIKAASLFPAGQAAGVISVKVAALTEGVVKAMFVTRIKSMTGVLLLAVAGVVGVTSFSGLPAPAQQTDDKQAAHKQAADKQADAGPSGANLIKNKSVQEDLKLTAEQVKSLEVGLQKVQEKYKEELGKVAGALPGRQAVPGGFPTLPDPNKYQELVRKVDAENKKVLADVLKPEQATRLKQIDLQLQGIYACQSKQVIEALKLTEDQKDQVKKIDADMSNALRELTGDWRNPPTMKIYYAEKKIRKEAAEKIPSLLAPEQRRRWEAMIGAPFQLEPVDAPKNRPADGKVGHIKVEARGRVIEKRAKDGSTPYFLRVDQNEWRIQTKADKATVIRHVLDLKDAEVVLNGKLAWLPKGARADSDDDYALGFVIQEEAQLRRLDPKDQSPHYIKVEARGDWMILDNSLVILVQLQETPAKRVSVSGPWRSWGLDRLTSVLLKTKQATIAGYATWEVRTDLVIFRLRAPQLLDPPLDVEPRK